MNRIVLIGNGFDLAHGMSTGYKDFLQDFWRNTIKKVRESPFNEKYEDEEISIDYLPMKWIGDDSFSSFSMNFKHPNKGRLKFNNRFLERINAKNNLQNWVDIENEYYLSLKEAVLGSGFKHYMPTLNLEFEKIKILLENYLGVIETDFSKKKNEMMNKDIQSNIYSNFKVRDFSEGVLDDFELMPKQILFLNFNYTFTELLYIDQNDTNQKTIAESIHIHGSLKAEDKNPMIFGFGDEIDEEYKSIENLNDNSCLENIKSIRYSDTDNYKKLLRFVNSGRYQIFIFGHSCGLSDRTLLNTLFEHKNCVSIKPFYHKKSDGDDNYSDIIRNISRNFNDKVKMRDKVVNKKYCEPLC